KATRRTRAAARGGRRAGPPGRREPAERTGGEEGQRSATVTPPENGESCSSIAVSTASFGTSNSRIPLTLFPGLIVVRNALESLRLTAAVPESASNRRPL